VSKQESITFDFTAGELSPKFLGRFDLATYYKGAQTIINWIPISPGGATYRPGTIRQGLPTGDIFKGSGATRIRLRAFNIRRGLSYVLEFGNRYIRFWKAGQLLGGGSPIEVVTQYATADLEALQFTQDATSLVITAGPQVSPVAILTMTAVDTFTFGYLPITGNSGDLPFQPSADSVRNTLYALNALVVERNTTGLAVYKCTVAGTSHATTEPTWPTSGTVADGGVTWAFQYQANAAGKCGDWPASCAFHDGCLYVANSPNDPQGIWKSEPFDYGNFTLYDTISTTAKQLRDPANLFTGTTHTNTTIDGIAADEIAKFKAGDRITGTGIVGKEKEIFAGTTTLGSAIITNVSSAVIARLTAGETIAGTNIPSSTIQSMGANSITLNNNATASSAINTFERAARWTTIVTISTASIVVSIAATASATVTLKQGWADPAVPDYQDVTTTRDVVTEKNALEAQIASDQCDQIQWLASGSDLVVGTASGERITPSGANPLNFTCKRQTAYGSSPVQPFLVNDALVFVDGSGRGVRQYFYQNEAGAYQSPELTFTAGHILAGEVREMEYQNTPIPVIWFLLETGELIGCHYERNSGLSAWFHVQLAGATIESIAVVPGATYDELYMAVNRSNVRGLERLGLIGGTEGHLDAAATATKAAGKITGITWITGAATVVYAGVEYPITIAGNEATLPAAIPNGSAVLVGKGYTGTLKTMPSQAKSVIGPANMRPQVVTFCTTRILASYPMQISAGGGELERADFTGPATGDIPIPVQGIWDTEGSISIIQDEPFDTTVLAVAIELDAGG
jgi:hypothetical protein